MSVNALQPSPEDRERTYRARLKDEPMPAVIIDCAAATVLAANAGGLQALGLTPADRLPAPLDSAMPAVAVLRDLQNQASGAPVRCPLMFWRHGRTSSRLCDVRAVDAICRSHVLVVFRADGDQSPLPITNEPHTIALDGPTAANDDSPPRIVRDDSETLKEIARRIREGQCAKATDPPAEVGDSAPTSRNAVESLALPATVSDEDTNTIVDQSQNQTWDRSQTRPANAASAGIVTRALPLEDIAKLAHELKTPLTAIAAASEIMRDERLGTMGNDKYLGYASDIHDSATHALAVIAEMLAAASGERTTELASDAVDLTDLAARTLSSLQPLAGQRGLTLALDGEPNLMPVRASATAIRQILLNLLTNALKFTPPGGDVRVATGYLNDGAVYLVVRDTGDGMTAEALNHTFDDSNYASMQMRAGGGRGIGLRLVRRLAAENGAEFEIDTSPGKGTVILSLIHI